MRPGDLYMRTGMVYEGTAETLKHCARCWDMFKTLVDMNDDPVLFTLDCGETLDPDEYTETAYLAFATRDEAQEYALADKARLDERGVA